MLYTILLSALFCHPTIIIVSKIEALSLLVARSSSSSSSSLASLNTAIRMSTLPSETSESLPKPNKVYVVFGRPGSGKTTVATKAYDILFQTLFVNQKKGRSVMQCKPLHLDLDVCVTPQMRDNFGQGIYPTIDERKVFAINACKYVDEQIVQQQNGDKRRRTTSVIISFSFVNTDLRDIFRTHFPTADWILIDTTEKECTKRIQERKDHFYKGELSNGKTKTKTRIKTIIDDDDSTATKAMVDNDSENNDDWKFAPVDFPHTILDGDNSIDDNAKMIVDKIITYYKLKKERK